MNEGAYKPMSAAEPPIFLQGERLSLRPLRREDAAQYARWFNDQDVIRFMLAYWPMTIERETEFLDKLLNAKPGEPLVLGIWLDDGPKLIGNTGLHEISHLHQRAELGVFIGDKDEWGKGYGAEAIRLLLTYAFRTLNLRKAVLKHFSDNTRGRRLYDKLGFREVGRCREHVFIDGQWRDEIIMELFAEEFLKNGDGR